MKRVFQSISAVKALRAPLAAAMALSLAGCVGSVPGTVSAPGALGPGPQPVVGETIGTGSVRVGLLLPFSAQGNAGNIAQIFKNSATLAVETITGNDMMLLVKDTSGTAAGAQQAAQQALSEGAELILGPVFADSVRAAGQVSKQANRPLIGFSSDPTAATEDVYLLSFLTGNDVRRIISHAGANGKRSFAALISNDAFGQVAEAAFRSTVPAAGGRILAIERYTADPTNPEATQNDVQAKAVALAQAAPTVDAIFIPQGAVAPFAAQVLQQNGVNLGTSQILGTGTWDDPRVISSNTLVGSVFAAPDKAQFNAFSSRYQARFGSAPPRTASLAYDASILAMGLIRTAGARRFERSIITNEQGYIGTDGVFRLNPNGLNDRSLAVYQINNGVAQVLEPAPQSLPARNAARF